MSFTLGLRLVANELKRLTKPEPLYNGHLGDKELKAVVARWPLWGGKGVTWHLFSSEGVTFFHIFKILIARSQYVT